MLPLTVITRFGERERSIAMFARDFCRISLMRAPFLPMIPPTIYKDKQNARVKKKWAELENSPRQTRGSTYSRWDSQIGLKAAVGKGDIFDVGVLHSLIVAHRSIHKVVLIIPQGFAI